METLCNTVTSQLIDHLRSGFETHPTDKGCVVVTPYTYADMAAVELFVEQDGNSYILSDAGETLNMLFVNGLYVEANRGLMQQAQNVASSHEVLLRDSVISISTTEENLGKASHRLLNAIQAIGYLLYRRSHRRITTFDIEVRRSKRLK